MRYAWLGCAHARLTSFQICISGPHSHINTCLFVFIALIKQTFIFEAARSCNAPDLASLARSSGIAAASPVPSPHISRAAHTRTGRSKTAPDGHCPLSGVALTDVRYDRTPKLYGIAVYRNSSPSGRGTSAESIGADRDSFLKSYQLYRT